MPSHLALRHTRVVVIIVAASLIGGVALVTALWPWRLAEASEAQPHKVHSNISVVLTAPQSDQSTVRQINLHANDLVVDPNTQRIYASVPSAAGTNGNTITSVDPVTGLIGPSIFIGSEPGKMVISGNGQFVYVALAGAGAVRRFDVATQTAGPQISLGNDFSAGPFFIRDMAVEPGNPATLAVFRSVLNGSIASVAIYDNVDRRPAIVSGSGLTVTFSATDLSRLYALGVSTLRRMTVSSSGVALLNSTPVPASGAIQFDEGRLYASSGHVLDPETGSLLGTFVGTNINSSTPFVSDSIVRRAYFLTAPPASPGLPRTLTLRVFDQQTFVPLGTLEIPNVLGSPTRLVRWGSNGLAFCTTSGQFFVIQTTLVPSPDPVPTPTPSITPTPVPTPTPIPTPAPGELRQISLATNDLVVVPNSQTIFASIPSSAGANGNSLAPIDATAGTVEQAIFVGSEPNKLAISDNGASIYVGLDGANVVRRFDVASRTAGLQFSLGSHPLLGAYRAEDMAVAPGQPDVLAVSRLRLNASPRHAGVAVYDNGVQRMNTPTGGNAIEFSSSPQVLYGHNTEESFNASFSRMAVASCGVISMNQPGNLFGAPQDFKADNGVAYSANGRAIDPEAGVLLGTFPLRSPGSFPFTPSLVAPDSRAGRVHFVIEENGAVFLRVFDIDTFLKVGELQLPGVTGTVASLVRWGTHGLAFRNTAGQVFLLQHSLIGGSDPSFTPAPVPPPPTGTATVRVSSFNGDPGGVTINVTGAITVTGTTDDAGNFVIPGVPPCGSLTVTPSKTNYVFNPANMTINDLPTSTLSFIGTLKTVGFQQNSATVPESHGRVVFPIRRSVGTDPATVIYETRSGTASDRSDFNTTLGMLQFPAGSASAGITLLVTNDTLVEGPETFTLTLRDPTGDVLAPGFSTLTVTIIDDDTQPGAPNPLADARFFVRQHYQDFLNREATSDASGFNFWTNQITSCDSESDPQRRADCLTLRRINVSAAFFISIEFQQTGYLVHRFYAASYPPSATRPRGLPRFSEFLRDTQEVGRGVIVGEFRWEQKLEENKQAFALAWVSRPEFLAEHPEGQTADQFVDSLFQNTGATPTAAERAAAITAFGNGMADGRARALRSLTESASVYNRHFNSAFVLAQYFGYLRRNPDDAPDVNFDGYQFWLDKLNQFNGNFVQADMVKAFLVSEEYQRRFGPATFDINQ